MVLILFILMSDNLFSVVFWRESFCFQFIKFHSFMVFTVLSALWFLVLWSLPGKSSFARFPQFPFWFLLLLSFTILIFWSRNGSYFSAFLVAFFWNTMWVLERWVRPLDSVSHLDSVSFTLWFHDSFNRRESIIWKPLIPSKSYEKR